MSSGDVIKCFRMLFRDGNVNVWGVFDVGTMLDVAIAEHGVGCAVVTYVSEVRRAF